MNANMPSINFNIEGYYDLTAANAMNLKQTPREFVDWLWHYLEYHIPKKNGLGQLKRLNKRQFIRDKLEMLKDEFCCKITYEDVTHIVFDAWDYNDVDRMCRDIILRNFEDMEE